MIALADVLRRHGPAYLARHDEDLLPSHRRALQAITSCRTPFRGGTLATCNRCARIHLLYHSCRHRACPRCGHAATLRWLDRQRDTLLPVPYFHVVFTLPAELRLLVRSHQKVLIHALFHAAFGSLATLCRDPKYLGNATIGALAVLHTWSRTLEWHPHVHMLVPGGGLAPDGTWRSVRRPARRRDFLVPVEALAKIFRARFLRRARRALPQVSFPTIPWDKSWVVYAAPTLAGATDHLLRYLGRYVHRTALTDKRLVAVDDRTVTFSYRDSRDHRQKTMTLPPHEFLRRFLQHVPPRGLHRVRAFGLLHPAHRTALRRLQLLLGRHRQPPLPPPDKKPLRCPYCRAGELQVLRLLTPAECLAMLPLPAARAPPATLVVRREKSP